MGCVTGPLFADVRLGCQPCVGICGVIPIPRVPIAGIVPIKLILVPIECVVPTSSAADRRLAVVAEELELLARRKVVVGLDTWGVLDGLLVVIDDDVVALDPSMEQRHERL